MPKFAGVEAARFIFAILFVAGTGRATAQRVVESFRADSGAHRLARAPVVPFSESVTRNGRPFQAYTLDCFTGRISGFETGDSVTVSYLPDPEPAPKSFFFRPLPGKVFVENPKDSLIYIPDTLYESPPEDAQNTLKTSGSLARSFTVGTDRDLAVNSEFRMSAEGVLGNEIEINALITDENVPLQPDGSTQNIYDFDRFLIQMRRGGLYATFGDLEIGQSGTDFANLYRNVLGAQAGWQKRNHQWSLSGSVAKGVFYTNTIEAENARQGPYRLTGKGGERFMIVMAGTEKVYLNGVLMSRGTDYVIDYNTAEITFLPARLITVNTRIVVDFEYVQRNYTRSLMLAKYEGKYWNDKINVRASYGREADNPNAPLDVTLGERERLALRNAGDNPQNAVVSAVDTIPFTKDAIMYTEKDTLVNGESFKYFQYSNDSLTARFRVVFSYTGQGKGDYIREATQLNGNIFKFVGPGNGDYLPIRNLPMPQSLQVLNIRFEVKPVSFLSLYNETSLSVWDVNRLSSLNDDDNVAVALKPGIGVNKWPVNEKKTLFFSSDAHFQFVDKDYQNFDRVYEKEYGRQWNFNDLGARSDERLAGGFVQLSQSRGYAIKAGGGYRSAGDSLLTFRQELTLSSSDTAVLQTQTVAVRLETRDLKTGGKSEWYRLNSDVYKIVKRFRPGIETWYENKKNTPANTGSFEFVDVKPYFRSFNAPKFDYDFSFQFREDKEFFESQMRLKSHTFTGFALTNWRPVKTFNLQNTGTFSRYAIKDGAFVRAGFNTQETIMNEFNAVYQTKKQSLRIGFKYKISAERAARRTERFVKVNTGMGQYVWEDKNENGLEELDEFVLTPNPLVANYVRLLIPTQTLFPVTGTDAGFQFRFDFGPLFSKESTGFKKFLRTVSCNSAANVHQKRESKTNRLENYWLDFNGIFSPDTLLLVSNFSLRNDLFVLKNHPKSEFHFNHQFSSGRQFLSLGFDERTNNALSAMHRAKIFDKHMLETTLAAARKTGLSPGQLNRNFDVSGLGGGTVWSWAVNNKTRFSSGYEVKFKENRNDNPQEGETKTTSVLSNKWVAESRVSFKITSVLLRAEYRNNAMRGRTNLNASYELLDGLQAGNNGIFNVVWSQFLSKSLELSMVYDGRFATGRRPVHSARTQIRALF